MKGIMLNEVENAVIEFVVASGKHSTLMTFVVEKLGGFGYPPHQTRLAIEHLLREGILTEDEGYLFFVWPEAEGDMAQALAEMKAEMPSGNIIAGDLNGGFAPQAIPSVEKDYNPAVHSPSHYTRGGIETIDFIEAKGLNFHLGNTVKYVSRAGFKEDAKLQDLEKALWYLTREINRIKTQEP